MLKIRRSQVVCFITCNKCGKFLFYHLTFIQYWNLPFKPLFYHRSESESEVEEEAVPLLSEEEMNKLGAKLVKAEIMGNTVGCCCVNTLHSTNMLK